MSDQGSTYAILQSVPLMVSPLYKLPKKILVASELKMVPDDITKLPSYPFAVEREVITQVEAARKKTFEAEEAFRHQKMQYEQDKLNKQKAAARRIAPGFLDTETRMLQPQPTYVYEQPTAGNSEESVHGEDSLSESTSPKILQPGLNGNDTKIVVPLEIGPEKHFDYLKFEQGLAPADPWDAPENDMVALRSILGSPKLNYEQRRTSTPPAYPPQQYQQPQPQHQPLPQQQQQQQQHSRHYQKNEGAYWNFQTNNSNANSSNGAAGKYHQPQTHHGRQIQQHSHSVPALPPKLFPNPPLPTSSTSSPIVSPPTLPPPSDYHANNIPTATTPPPLPPLPPSSQQQQQQQQQQKQQQQPNEDLINELGNMGFSRGQAIDALEKNDHDLIKATNFLLDQA